jgi:hypothetical protein
MDGGSSWWDTAAWPEVAAALEERASGGIGLGWLECC